MDIDTNWKEQAACYNTYPDTDFFNLRHPQKAKRLKDMCDVCPVWEPCLDLGLEMDQDFGLWGGVTFCGDGAQMRERIELAVVRREQRFSRGRVG